MMLLFLLLKTLFLLAVLGVSYVILNWELANTIPVNAKTGKPLSLANLTIVELDRQAHFVTLRSSADPSQLAKHQVPVLLILHGGPGLSDIPFLYETDFLLENNFVVARYDQRSAGKSCRFYNVHHPLTLEEHIEDGIAMAEYLKDRFWQEKIFLAGRSWGATLALGMAKQRPDLFQFVAVWGTPVHGIKNNLMAKADLPMLPYDGDFEKMTKHESWVTKAGGVYHTHPKAWVTRLATSIAQHYGVHQYIYWTYTLVSPEFSWADLTRVFSCWEHTTKELAPAVQNYDAYNEVDELKVPVVFIHGRHDHLSTVELAEDYFKAFKAPWKKFLWFEQSGHFADRDEPVLFQETLIKTFLETTTAEIAISEKSSSEEEESDDGAEEEEEEEEVSTGTPGGGPMEEL